MVFRTWDSLLHALLAFRNRCYSDEFSLRCDLELFFSCSFQYTFFVILSVLTMIQCGNIIFWSCLFGILHASYICTGMSFLGLRKSFFYGFVEDLVYATDLVSSLSPCLLFEGLVFSQCPSLPVCSFPVGFFFTIFAYFLKIFIFTS